MNALKPGRIESLQRVVRLRPDIEWSQFAGGVNPTWVARDPVSLEYFHFSLLERSIAQSLDGRRTLAEVFEEHRSHAIRPIWLLQLIDRFDSSCLTVPSAAGNAGRQKWLSHQRQRRRSRIRSWLSPLAARVKLFDPTRLLSVLAPLARVLFHPMFVVAWLVFGLIVAFLVAVRWLQGPTSLTSALHDLTFDRALGLVLAFVCVKSLHELGHALACKKWNAECHEIGLFFLVFTPCLYCDTSDSWKLPSPWRRACIAAAGIYVELALAALAGFLWLISIPGSALHLLSANVMLICSLSTVLVNANPLLRYDGYYVLSDLWRVPNLHEQSREALRSMATAWLSASRPPGDRWDADPRGLALFGLAAWVYRHLVLLMIAWFVWVLLAGFGLELLGAALVALTLGSAVLANVVGWWQWSRELSRRGDMRIWRVAAVVCVVSAVTLTFFIKRWPTFAACRAVATLAHRTPIYARQSGVLTHFVQAGDRVHRGQEIARLESPELELELIDARGRHAYLKQRAEQLQARLVDDESGVSELATLVEQLAQTRDRLNILEQEAASLVSLAPRDGVIVAGQRQLNQTLTEPLGVQPPSPLLTRQNIRSSVERGTLLGWVCQPRRFEVTAYVVEQDAELLRAGMIARCRWDCLLGHLYWGTISRISPEPIIELPEALAGDRTIRVQRNPQGQLLPEQPYYEVTVELPEIPSELSHQSVATIHFETQPRTWYESSQRFVGQQIRPEL